MEFKVLAVGDVVGGPGMERIRRQLRQLRRSTGADFVVVNGENASVVGITPNQAEDILDAGADAITLGNHSFSKREITPFLDESDRIVRPANYAPQVPGKGWTLLETRFGDVALIDLIGRCGMDNGPDSEPTPIWVADEVSAVVPYAIGEDEALERFEELWAELAPDALSSAEVAAMLGDLTEAVLSMMGGE